MISFYREPAVIGQNTSPLDLVSTAATASADWTIKKSTVDATDGFLDELWIESVSTSTGNIIGIMCTFDRTNGVRVWTAGTLNISLLITEQVGLAPSNFSYTNVNIWGNFQKLDTMIVALSEDFVYLNFSVSLASSSNPYYGATFIGVLEKSVAYNDGVVFLNTNFQGESAVNILYEGLWYGDSVAANVNNRHGRINATFASGMFPESIASARYFYSKVSVHANIEEFGTDNKLALLGFLPSGIMGSNSHSKNKLNLDLKLLDGDYKGYPDASCEAIDMLLFPTF